MSTKTNKDSRRRYTKEFKESVVREHLEGKTLTELSTKYTIPVSTLGTWFSIMKDSVKRDMEKDQESDAPTIPSEVYAEIGELKSIIENLKQEIHEKDKELEKLSVDIPTESRELLLTNAKLEEEIIHLHEIIAMYKIEARREIKTLKDAIIIMGKNYNEE